MSQLLEDVTAPVAVHDGYRVKIERARERIRAVCRGVTVADSARALVMHETRYPMVYYFPRDDVEMSYLVPESQRTHCPFKGNATYWSLKIGDRLIENAAWSYEEPFDESSAVKGYIAFDWSAIDAWFADDHKIAELPPDTAPAVGNPLVDWLVDEAWQPQSIPELLTRFAALLQDQGFPIWRVRLLIQTLHPQLFALTFTWQSDSDEITEFRATHAGLRTSQYQDSPFATIIRGEGGIRRRLDVENPRLDYPILESLVADGATDYVAVPLRFSDGQINILVLVSDAPGGFRTEELAKLYEILANFSRLLETHAQRLSSLTLLQTYLGRNAGRRVMDGLVQRGDGEEIEAVIWMSDLRGSTSLAESVSREEYLEALNQYFDCVAGAVIEHDGEILKFIGDAVLAIFPIGTSEESRAAACRNALAAADAADVRLAEVNASRVAQAQPQLTFGTGLHVGSLTYGNIGTPKRLDFTVIGSAVNETSRIEGLCRPLGHSVIASGAFAAHAGDALQSIGVHDLRGVSQSVELYTVKTGASE